MDKTIYLSKYSGKIEFDKNGYSIDSDKFCMFLSGELHNCRNNKLLELSLFKNFYYNSNVRYLVFEYSDFIVKQIDEYLKNGNENKLNQILYYDSKKNGESEKFYIELRNFWQSLPPDDKFKVIGVDVNFFSYDAITELIDLIPNQEYCEENGELNKLLTLNKRRKTLKILKQISGKIKSDSVHYKAILNKNYQLFMHLMEGSLIGLQNSKNDAKSLEEREQYIYNNIKQLFIQNPSAKIYGQFGRVHVPIIYQKSWLHVENWLSLGARLNTNHDSPVKDKVCSILYFYPSNVNYEKKNYVEPIIKAENIQSFMNFCTSSLTFFKLDGNDSPFVDMAEKFQYMIINKE